MRRKEGERVKGRESREGVSTRRDKREVSGIGRGERKEERERERERGAHYLPSPLTFLLCAH